MTSTTNRPCESTALRRSPSTHVLLSSFESGKYSIELSESTPINTSIVHVHASDADIGLNGRITYDFTDASKQFNKIFTIDNATGLVSLRSLLDYEQRSSYVFYVEARDAGQEMRSSQTLINITVLNENDCYPLITFRFLPDMNYSPATDRIEIAETYPIDKFFAQILVTDQDHYLTGRIHLWFNDTSFELYPIDNVTYFLNRSTPFDFEQQPLHRLVFFAQDDHPTAPLRSNRTLTIQILDENDNEPEFFHAFFHLSIDENNAANMTLTKIEATDRDQGDNGRLTYEILTNQTSFPFEIDSQTGVLRCLDSLDREKQSYYLFDVLARDHGSPRSLSSSASIRIDINDLNDNPPAFEREKYEFFIDENFTRRQPIGTIRAFDADLNVRLIYRIHNKEDKFTINQRGELFLRASIDREEEDMYELLAIVSDGYFQRSIPVTIHILDVNDCQPHWKRPSANHTFLIINKDQMTPGTMLLKFEATDADEKSNGNGRLSYSLEDNYAFLALLDTGELMLNATASIGRYSLRIKAEDHGKLIQRSSSIDFDLFVGDNLTNGSLFYDELNSMHALSATKRVLLLITFFVSLAVILVFLISLVLVLICRYRREKYLYYVKCNGRPSSEPKMLVVEHRTLTDSSSNSSKLSLVRARLSRASMCNDASSRLFQNERLIDQSSSSPSYTGNRHGLPLSLPNDE